MRRVSDSPDLVPSGIDGSCLPNRSGPEENFQPTLVGDVCRRVWGKKADAIMASIWGKTDRAARDVLSGKVPLPSVLMAAINVELARRPRKKGRR